jgi:hypothetical protein
MPDDRLLSVLRRLGRQQAGDLASLLQVSRPTLMRMVRGAGEAVVAGGRARRTAYAARRSLAGSEAPLPVYRIDRTGRLQETAALHLTHPEGCRLDTLQDSAWPLDADMQDGWFDGLPYFFQDMRPSGFLGRSFARHHAALLQVDEDPTRWTDDDVLRALSLLGSDTPGDFIIGEPAARRWLELSQQGTPGIADKTVDADYALLADQAMSHGWAGSSAAGEFPKFTALRRRGRQAQHVLVKFSGSDNSPGTTRWSDLLVCEHLAATALAAHGSTRGSTRVGIDAGIRPSSSRILQAGRRTFLEVNRFDRHGLLGRSGVVSWLAVNAAFFGQAGKSWAEAGRLLRTGGLIAQPDADGLARLWHFGQLIANTDMHDANLAFEPEPVDGRPGLKLAPVYDMLPMLYAPSRGVELPDRTFAPRLPLPAEESAWREAAPAALAFWQAAADDARISRPFRRTCAANAKALRALLG